MSIPLFLPRSNGDPPILTIALQLLSAGVAVVFIEPNGSKKPFGSWRQWQKRLPTETELRSLYWRAARRFRTHNLGLAIICGVASGGVEVLDFDDKGVLFPLWIVLVQHIVERLPIVRTPSGGAHVYYRCKIICGNKKVAVGQDDYVIESRGDGGVAVAPGSHPNCHPTKRTYDQISGPPLTEIPYITPDERRELWAAARKYDKRTSHIDELVTARAKQLRSMHYSAPTRRGSADEFIEHFNRDASWTEILIGAGWKSTDGVHWTRPGKQEGVSGRIVSATDGTPVLCVFSTNAGELSASDGHRNFNKFSAYAALYHGGSRIDALKKLNPRKA